MKVLAIDCATAACSVALFSEGSLVESKHHVLGRGHAERLIPMIAAMPDRGRADRVLVSRGPGSFTGVRIGIAAARALAVAWKCNVAGYPTMALLAAMARRSEGQQSVSVAMEGGHGEWYVQNFDGRGLPERPHASLAPDDAVRLARHPLVVGTRALELTELRGCGTALSLYPDASAVLDIPVELLTPEVTAIYGRPPDAKPVG